MGSRSPAGAGVPFGINLIGYLSGNLGLGVSARHYLRLLDEAGLDVCPRGCP